jgi:hypothetical protein
MCLTVSLFAELSVIRSQISIWPGWVSKISELFVSETLGASIGLESTKLVTHFNVHIPISSFIHQIIFSTKSSIHSSFIFRNSTHFIKTF